MTALSKPVLTAAVTTTGLASRQLRHTGSGSPPAPS